MTVAESTILAGCLDDDEVSTVPRQALGVQVGYRRAMVSARPSSSAGVACIHHWVLGRPEGPSCEGRCKRCGATRTYETGATNELAPVGKAVFQERRERVPKAPKPKRPRSTTHCNHGHERTPANTRVLKNGKRVCSPCANRREKAYAAKKRAEKVAAGWTPYSSARKQ